MADLYLGDGAEPEHVSGQGLIAFIFNWLGAIMSVALIVGLGIWGYKLLVRDVSGVPVVRALEGPMRVAPDDPGGEQAEHQGLAVNTIAAEGMAAGPADRLVLAPPPLDLSDEDQPAPSAVDVAVAEAIATPYGGSVALEMADELTQGIQPLELADEPDVVGTEAIPSTIKGVARSPLPRPRPGDDGIAMAVAASVMMASAPVPVEIDPSAVRPGDRLVQFGAFASPDEARAEWARLDERFTDFLSDKKRVIEKAVSGGKTFYRLRAVGFADVSDARRFCSAFVAERQACIPVVAR